MERPIFAFGASRHPYRPVDESDELQHSDIADSALAYPSSHGNVLGEGWDDSASNTAAERPPSLAGSLKDQANASSDSLSAGQRPFWKLFLAHIGPGFVVAVGYMDPGNWATDLAGGSKFQYKLLLFILVSNCMAVFLQNMAIKVGLVTGCDLALLSRKTLHPWLNKLIYVVAEIGILATDLAEVIGSAIALKLLFGIPLVWGILITGTDVIIILSGLADKYMRYLELGIMFLVLVVGACFGVLMGRANPVWIDVFKGYLPLEPALLIDQEYLFLAIAIVGATVMPHNLYIHSYLVQSRSVDGAGMQIDGFEHQPPLSEEMELLDSPQSRKLVDDPMFAERIRTALHLSYLDSAMALTFALYINSAILIVAGGVFFVRGQNASEISDAFGLISTDIGHWAAVVFAVALLLSGQTSTITGTIAGQVVMEGFTQMRLPLWIRRLVTRAVAIIPGIAVAIYRGDSGVNDLLVLSQVILSICLPFSVWPLIYFCANTRIMTVRYNALGLSQELSLANHWVTTVFAVLVGSTLTFLNLFMIYSVL
ncbi:natural resistance-associated macrophage protein-domain-containing protein [Polychytrium aggregatum]|uniref:natural resistance-associated macrophage protein-domain-containing protein n=1 Tax=Polychytrium aggregatum TaxID=110093 RepID=UPI0022FF2C8D|nr:natural resistance-associated macrophage protein-domain-containing protein [Polychytrium aggregatum]KAI9193191.1 natural resistance-associated macrophage protein-domain-containing protein [Polychytrium aggregatum]